MSDFVTYLREGRHMFSACTHCGSIARLSELELERKGRYSPDWLDEISAKLDRLGQRTFELQQKAKDLQAQARSRAEKEILPKRLLQIAPALSRSGVDPRDVSALFDPVEFVVFRGMNSDDGVRDVQFLSVGPKTEASRRLEAVVASRAYDWNLIRVSDDGTLTQSKKYASDSRARSLAEF